MIRKHLLITMSALALAGLVAAEGVTAGAQAGASTSSNGRWRGQQAIERLGARLPSVAAAHGMKSNELIEHLTEDETLYVDGTDKLLYVEPANVGPTAADSTFDPSIPRANAFLLNSRPEATRVIFLDFDGHMLSGTAWNSSTGGDCYAEPFSADADGTTFTDSERDTIISVWKRVSEDYAMFDVNVTTQDPGYAAINRASNSDVNFGTRLLVTKSTSPCPDGATLYSNACGGGCGGVAYVGVYGLTGSAHDTYQPALVFQNGVGSGAKSITEAASHEVGHNIGLNHDGTSTLGYYSGHGSWAPIMGVGYSKAITQWSKGEYAGANNSQDDFVVAGNNGLPLRSDDHGNTAGTATALQGSPATVDGVISTRTDVDAFTVNASDGPATFTALPSPVSPNLDIKMELRNSAGDLVLSDDPACGSTNGDSATGLGASISTTLAAGTYTILIDGVGCGDPLSTGYTDYASLGNYRLTSTVVGPDGQAPSAVVSVSSTSGEFPLTVNFTGSGSSDPEGATLSYAWSFGTGDTSTLADPSYTYTSAGTYTASLTVTDDRNLSNTKSVTIIVTAPVRKIDVYALTVSGSRTRQGVTATASITIRDLDDTAVSGATVTGRWFNGTRLLSTRSGVTSASGVATISSGTLKVKTGTQLRFCITGLTLANGTWLTSIYSTGDCVNYTAP